jgi:hypothetical protein
MTTPEMVKLWCVLSPGSDGSFPVDVSKNLLVGDLKKLIKSEMSPALVKLAAAALTLYRVEIDDCDDRKTRINEFNRLFQNLDEDWALNEEKKLSVDFAGSPSLGKKWYTLVRLPEGESIDSRVCDVGPKTPTARFPPDGLEHTPAKSRDEVDCKIQGFLDSCRDRMRELLEKAGDVSSLLPMWKFDSSVDKQLAGHISNLRIPAVANAPSLLLHGLGEDNLTRIRMIFSRQHTCVT